MVGSTIALAVLSVTLAAVSLLGVLASRGRVESIEDYVSARDSAGSGTLTATLIASSMGAWILLSPAEVGTSTGLTAVIGYGLGSAVPMVAFAIVGPRIRRVMPAGHSLTEFARARFGPAMHAYVLLISGFYMFVFLAAELTGVTTAVDAVAGVPRWQTAALVGGFVLTYTAYGGLRASVVTDAVQSLLILPLLVLGGAGAVVLLGGTDRLRAGVVAANPALLDPGYAAGVAYGFTLVLAVLGAELLNQAWWQRIYAAADARTLRRSFLVAAVAVVPMVVVAGLFGVFATGLGLVGVGQGSVAFFLVVRRAFPAWIALLVVVLATLLVMSTADTLFNAIASLVTTELPRLLADPDRERLTAAARLLTVLVGIASLLVALRARSVLSLFLLADLLAAATFAPLFAGLYVGSLAQRGAVVAAAVALAVGLAYFPRTNAALATLGFARVLPAPNLLAAFVSAVGLSVALTAGSATLGVAAGRSFDFDRLAREVRKLDAVADGGAGGDQPADGCADGAADGEVHDR
ncbi:MAG: sodium:proline symporter [Haloarculaceae archaeon]